MDRNSINRENGVSISQQIVQLIIGEISSGLLKTGDKLIAERKLANILGVSRGTVNAAYTTLKNKGIIDSNMGGYYRVVGVNESAPYRLSNAEAIIDEMLVKLHSMNLSNSEISQLLSIRLRQDRSDNQVIHVAVVECRKDIFYLFENQLSRIPHIELSLFLLDDVLRSSYVADQIMECDIIFTTAIHHYDLTNVYPQMEAKTVEIVTAWSQKTVFELATIKKTDKLGIIYSNSLTVKYIQRALDYFRIEPAAFSVCNEGNIQYLDDFLQNQDVIIAEPPCSIFQNLELLSSFQSTGGNVISFEYSIDRGSLMTIEKSISDILASKQSTK